MSIFLTLRVSLCALGGIIGSGVWIYQQVTRDADLSTSKYPIIENKVVNYLGAQVVGGVKLGRSAVVGANAVVVRDESRGGFVGGVPFKPIGREPQ